MAKINQNLLAKEVAGLEGGMEELNIAQIKEVIARTLEVLADRPYMSEVIALVEKHKH